MKSNDPDAIYKNLVETVLEEGEEREDRTGVGTTSIFGYSYKHDLRRWYEETRPGSGVYNLGVESPKKGLGLISSKKVLYRKVIAELLAFLRGETWLDLTMGGRLGFTEAQSLWKPWATKVGYLGPIYGYQWRYWQTEDGFIDQIEVLIEGLRNNPASRRHIVSAWNVADLGRMALQPCHMLFQCYVSTEKYLDLRMDQRSCDVALGLPFNISSYCILLHMLARELQLTPRYFIHNIGDLHIYNGHQQKLREQIEHPIDGRSVPWLEIQSDKSFWELVNTNDIDAFVVHDYYPNKFRKYEVAV